MSERMTIKQLADALGVSKTFVRKHMDDDFRLQHTETTANGVITIDPDGCKLLSETIGNRMETTENQVAETTANSENPLYGMLKDELDAKNRQIEQLQTQVSELTKANMELAQSINKDRANELAGTLQQFLPEAASGGAAEPVEAFQGEDVRKPAQDPSGAQDGLQKAVKNLSIRQKLKLLFGKF